MTAIIANEIKALRKGRGLGASELETRLGPNLRDLARAAAPRDISELGRELSSAIGSHAFHRWMGCGESTHAGIAATPS
jgi:hypothetical protein